MERIGSNTVTLSPEEAADSVFSGAIGLGLLRPGVYLDPSVTVVDGRVTLTFSKCVPKVRHRRRGNRRRVHGRQQADVLSGGQILLCMFALLILILIVGAWLMSGEKSANRQQGSPTAASLTE